MRSGPTYYDFFGVSRTASAEQIRTAYLWLMKQHHPDLTSQADKERSGDFAAILNRSYDVLKDPRKRARYDDFIERQAGGSRKNKAKRALLTGSTRRPQRPHWDGSSTGAAALACLVLLLIAAAVWMPSNSPDGIGPTAAAASSPPPRKLLDLDYAQVREQIQFAIAASPDEAELASRRCFEAARDRSSVAEAEKCVVYDDAYLQWNTAGTGALAQPAYFHGDELWSRHRDALAVLGSVDSRLHQLREATLSALLDEIRFEVRAGSKSAALRSLGSDRPLSR